MWRAYSLPTIEVQWLTFVQVIALWVRSYWWLDYRIVSGRGGCVFVQSQQGQLRAVTVLALSPLTAANNDGSNASASSELFRVTFALPNTPHQIPKDWTAQLSDLREFGWDRYPDGYKFVIPHWIAAAICGGFAGTPWIRRFNLRVLFLGMTLVAALFGVAVRLD
jgi:hypothetical protein